MASRIPIHVSNYNAFVWDVDHVATLRSEHRICGVLSGTLPNLTQQNVFLGLPLVLMPEELVLLIEKQLATIVHDPSVHHAPTLAQLEAWDASRRQDVAQLQLARLERLERQRPKDDDEDRNRTTTTATATAAAPIDDDDDVVVQEDPPSAAPTQRKRAEREEARRRRPLAATADADAEADDADADTDTDTDTAEAVVGGGRGRGGQGQERAATPAAAAAATAATPVPPSSSLVYTVSVPTTSDAFAWYNYNNNDDDNDAASGAQRRRDQHHQRTYETLDAACGAGVWSYPANADERARCEVFRDLWEKGYYMGGGIKFGGDWLVYPGDPMRYHSHFVATVQASPSAPLRPMEVVAHGRLGTATKKAHLLCGWDPESREVTYISIEWAGFG